MTKTRIREIRATSKANSAHTGIISELLACIEELQSRTRRGEDISQPEELQLAAKVNPAKKARGTRQEVFEYAKEIGLTPLDALWFWEKITEGEKEGETDKPWKVGKSIVKDWKGRVRQWKLLCAFPSQKQNGGQHGAPARSVGPAKCVL